MRILQLVTRNELRGAEVFAGQLSDVLTRRGHQVVQAGLYRLRDADRQPLVLTDANCVELNGCVQGRLEPGAFLRLRRLIRDFGPDVVQANGFHALNYAALAKRFTRARWPLVYRNISIASRWIRNRLQVYWGRWLTRSLAYALSVSDASRADFIQTYRMREDLVLTVRRGVEIPETTDREAAHSQICQLVGADSDEALLFHLGGFTAEKNHSGLIEAFAAIQEDLPASRLVLCGDGPLRATVEQQISDAGFESRVHCLGNRNDARELLAGADLLLLTSLVEGIPGVVLEAAARRVPAVCTNVGAVAEAIQDGHSGVLVPPNDMQAMARVTCELLRNPDRRRSLGEAAYRHVCEHHSMERSVDQFESVYRQALFEAGG